MSTKEPKPPGPYVRPRAFRKHDDREVMIVRRTGDADDEEIIADAKTISREVIVIPT